MITNFSEYTTYLKNKQLVYLDKYLYICLKYQFNFLCMIPKFSKIEIMLINDHKNKDLPSKEKLEFFDCGLMITGDYIIVTIDTKEGVDKPNVSVGKIFQLNKIEAYRTTSY